MLDAILATALANIVLLILVLDYLRVMHKNMTILHLQLIEIEAALFEPDPDDGDGLPLPKDHSATVLKFKRAS